MCRYTSERRGPCAQLLFPGVWLTVGSPLTPSASISSDHYGFVTFYNVKDAFAAIDNGSKLRRPDEKPFDLCFGGRRQFCPSDYADLGKSREPFTPSLL